MATLSGMYKISKIIKKTNAEMFKKLIEGDCIELSVNLIYPEEFNDIERYVCCTNLRTHETVIKPFDELSDILRCFEFTE